MSFLEKVDPEVSHAIDLETQRQAGKIELIASENFVSEAVLEAQGSVMTNKYAEGYPGKRYYGGCEFVDIAETLAIERCKQLFGCDHVNVQPHSGTQANMAVYFSVVQPGDTILGMNLSHGGHLSHGSPANFSGKFYNIVPYGVNRDTETIDYDELEKLTLEHKPKMIIVGASAYPRVLDFEKFRKIADKVGAIIMADIAHIAGLVCTGLHPTPVPYCEFVTTTTHKTLRGPRGGLIVMGKDFGNPWGLKTPKGEIKMMSALLDSAVFPGIQGGPLEHVIAAKAVAFGEALSDEFMEYIIQVKKNAQVMAKAFVDKGYHVISGGTDNHLMLIDLRSKFPDLTGKVAENTLVKADITINKNMVPFDSRSPFTTSGIRVGTPAVTTRGLREEHMPVIVDLIDEVLSNTENEAVLEQVRKKVNEMMSEFPLFAW